MSMTANTSLDESWNIPTQDIKVVLKGITLTESFVKEHILFLSNFLNNIEATTWRTDFRIGLLHHLIEELTYGK